MGLERQDEHPSQLQSMESAPGFAITSPIVRASLSGGTASRKVTISSIRQGWLARVVAFGGPRSPVVQGSPLLRPAAPTEGFPASTEGDRGSERAQRRQRRPSGSLLDRACGAAAGDLVTSCLPAQPLEESRSGNSSAPGWGWARGSPLPIREAPTTPLYGDIGTIRVESRVGEDGAAEMPAGLGFVAFLAGLPADLSRQSAAPGCPDAAGVRPRPPPPSSGRAHPALQVPRPRPAAVTLCLHLPRIPHPWPQALRASQIHPPRPPPQPIPRKTVGFPLPPAPVGPPLLRPGCSPPRRPLVPLWLRETIRTVRQS